MCIRDRNSSLIHLNLSRGNLDKSKIEVLWKGIKKSKSLLAVHLSGNINDNGWIKNLISTKGRDEAIEKMLTSLKFKKTSQALSKSDFNLIDVAKSIPGITKRYTKSRRQNMMLEIYKQNQQRKLGLVQDIKAKFDTIDRRVVLYRFLGHYEITNSHVWKVNTSCWIGDKWKYTCIITNPHTRSNNFKQWDEMNGENYHQKITENNPLPDLMKGSAVNLPTICGNFNKWKCENMMKIDKFYHNLLKNKIPFKRVYVKEEEEELTSKISRILNEDIYKTYRNAKGFSSFMMETAMGNLMK